MGGNLYAETAISTRANELDLRGNRSHQSCPVTSLLPQASTGSSSERHNSLLLQDNVVVDEFIFPQGPLLFPLPRFQLLVWP